MFTFESFHGEAKAILRDQGHTKVYQPQGNPEHRAKSFINRT
jgi:hypothetical protein